MTPLELNIIYQSKRTAGFAQVDGVASVALVGDRHVVGPVAGIRTPHEGRGNLVRRGPEGDGVSVDDAPPLLGA
eukprot:scaffold647847_cov31-Prasinocladus_malaysianus.AAC.1